MCQGIRTALVALVNEELNVLWDSLRAKHGRPSAADDNGALTEQYGPLANLDHNLAGKTLRGAVGMLAKLLLMQITRCSYRESRWCWPVLAR